MNPNLEIIGAESNVIYYNLNKQFCNINKIVITSDIILNSFENDLIVELISQLSKSSFQDYSSIVSEKLSDTIMNSSFNSDFYKLIQDRLGSISQNAMDINLQGYNFMNSMSNSKFNIVLRCENFSVSKYYVEKGEILSNIKQLIRDYLKSNNNTFRLSRLTNFQVEIFESEDIYKSIILKKDGQKLVLCSNFGFNLNSPFDYSTGSELYYSKGDDFKFFENTQNNAIFRDHAKLEETEIHKQEKILSDEDLVLINKNTKNINDAIVELYINKKGALKIINLSLLENSLGIGTKDGILLNKSSKSYNKISILGLRDDLSDDLPNPKYLLIRNSNELKELLLDLSIIRKIDGLIFSENFYSPLFDKLGESLDIDIIYYEHYLQKTLEIELDLENLKIGSQEDISRPINNPFSNILTESNKIKDENLERLKNIDLSTPDQYRVERGSVNGGDVGIHAEKIISSPNSTINTTNTSSSSSSNSRKGALGMLVDSVLSNDSKPVVEEKISSKEENQFDTEDANPQPVFSDFGSMMDAAEKEVDISKSNLVQNNITSDQMQNANIDTFNSQIQDVISSSEDKNIEINKKVDVSKYENILATKIITSPNIKSNNYFVDSSSLGQITGGDIFYMTNDVSNLNNSYMNYVLPINLKSELTKNHYFIINNLNDYFLMEENCECKYFVNLSFIDDSIKKNFLLKCMKTCDIFGIILLKKDLDLVSEFIDKINCVFIKDLESDFEYESVKTKILGYEKKFLIKN